MEDDDDLVPLSALQHHLFCPRQCGLIHIERQWAENRFTAEGRLLHEKADGGAGDRRGKVRTLRALPLRSVKYGLTGVADVVELRGTKTAPLPCPVEYKRGKPKAHRADEVQLCAQALCLEEMFNVSIPEGALFYGETRRRTIVALDEDLRALTVDTVAAVRAMLTSCVTPPAVYAKRTCDACSLIEICRPRRLSRPPRVADWLAAELDKTEE
jgi:CRISPR-associated exonuclease Cas4